MPHKGSVSPLGRLRGRVRGDELMPEERPGAARPDAEAAGLVAVVCGDLSKRDRATAAAHTAGVHAVISKTSSTDRAC
jgi:hypothetical protein